VLAKIAAMSGSDRAMGDRLEVIIKASAGSLAETLVRNAGLRQGRKVVSFFRPARRFEERYATFGFNQAARLDEGAMWPTSLALRELTAADQARIDAR
jgi:hypothetical protein